MSLRGSIGGTEDNGTWQSFNGPFHLLEAALAGSGVYVLEVLKHVYKSKSISLDRSCEGVKLTVLSDRGAKNHKMGVSDRLEH